MSDRQAAADERVGEQSELRDRLVLLVGARRSGTNWLERILSAHPDVVAMPSETYLFSHGIRPLTELVQHASPGARTTGATYMEREAFHAALRDLMDRILTASLERLDPNARYLVERTPWHSQHLPLIASVYPDARVVHIIRDGRAVARSLTTLPGGPATITEAAVEWRDSVACRADGARLFGESYVEVRYEFLLEDPVAGAELLYRWLNLDVESDLGARVGAEARTEFNVDPGSPGIRADKWRDELSPRDLAEVDRVAGRELRELGYVDSRRDDAPIAEVADVSLGHVEAFVHGLRRPVRSAREQVRKRNARKARAEHLENISVPERFANFVAGGRPVEATALCLPEGFYRFVDDGKVTEGRGLTALRSLLDSLGEHHQAGLQPIASTHTFAPRSFTTVLTYRLGDGREWAQTSVYTVIRGSITELSIWRFERARSSERSRLTPPA